MSIILCTLPCGTFKDTHEEKRESDRRKKKRYGHRGEQARIFSDKNSIQFEFIHKTPSQKILNLFKAQTIEVSFKL